MTTPWWESFFDADYLRLWSSDMPESRTEAEVDFFVRAAKLDKGCRALDAACGYGRIARRMALRGIEVLGVDQSQDLIDAAQREIGPALRDKLRYRRHDLRQPLAEGGFDAALNVFSSLGYGDEDEDLAILRTLRGAVRPGGTVLIESSHRDAWAARLSRAEPGERRLEDGTVLAERTHLDAVSGRLDAEWSWRGPAGAGEKRASMRIYTITELIQLASHAGLRFSEALQSVTGTPFEASGPTMGGRVTIVCERPGGLA